MGIDGRRNLVVLAHLSNAAAQVSELFFAQAVGRLRIGRNDSQITVGWWRKPGYLDVNNTWDGSDDD